MTSTDQLFNLILSEKPDERGDHLNELDDIIRYTDVYPIRRILPTLLLDNTVSLTCGTCAYYTDSGLIDERDDAHLKYDGAHEARWYDETADDAERIDNDLDLIRAVIRQYDAQKGA